MEKFVDFMSGKYGRALRIVIGAVLVVVAVVLMSGIWMWVVAALGFLLVLSGVLKICLFNIFIGRKLTDYPK